MTIEIVTPTDLTPGFQKQITILYRQLNDTISQLPIQDILNEHKQTIIAICKENNQIIGIAMMATYKVISGYKGMIEDVVVHENYRGRGIGKKLMTKILEEATAIKLTDVLLFSGHHRTTAIALYKSLGFTLKNSGLYTLKISNT